MPKPPLILSVDDNEAARYALNRILRSAGFEVLEAATGTDALAQMAQDPDLVILDVNLPDMSGLEVCRRIKANPATAATLVLQTSATAIETNDRVRGLENGADMYMVSPRDSLEMVATVRALLRLRRAEQAKQELVENLDRARSEAELLNLVGVAASGEENLEQILTNALDHLREFIPFTGGSIALREEDELVVLAASGPYAETALGQRAKRTPNSRSWPVIDTHEPFFSNDLLKDTSRLATPIRSYMAVPLVSRDQTIGLFEVDSTEPDVFNQRHLHLLQKAARVLSGSVEMTRRYSAEKRALAEAELARHITQAALDRTASLQAVAAAMSELLTPTEIMEYVIREGASAIGASAGFIGLANIANRTMDVVATYGYAHLADQLPIPADATDPSGEAVLNHQPIWIESQADFKKHYPQANAIYSQIPFEALALIPLMIDDHVLGSLTFSFIQPKTFLAEDRAFLLTLAQNCGQTLERARLYTDLQNWNSHLEEQIGRRTAEVEQSRELLRQLNARVQATREAERKDLSREIHDQLGGALTGLKMDVARLKKNAKDEAVKDQLNTFSNTIDANIQLVRQIATTLRPSLLDDFGLVAALEWQLQEFEKRSGLKCKFSANVSEVTLSSDASTGIFRIFQETLTNVARHAQATQVNVTLDSDSEFITLAIHDNGRGISTSQLNANQSLGLAGMRERAHLLNGDLIIQGTRGQGTQVLVKIPLQASTPAAD